MGRPTALLGHNFENNRNSREHRGRTVGGLASTREQHVAVPAVAQHRNVNLSCSVIRGPAPLARLGERRRRARRSGLAAGLTAMLVTARASDYRAHVMVDAAGHQGTVGRGCPRSQRHKALPSLLLCSRWTTVRTLWSSQHLLQNNSVPLLETKL